MKNAFFRVLKISGKIFSRRYELLRDSQESILGMVVCKFILLVFSGGDSLLFMSSGLKSGGSLSPDLVVVLDTHVLECYLGHCQFTNSRFPVQFASGAVRFRRSQLQSGLQPDTYALKKKGNEQQFSFTRKVANTSRAALKALESGEIPKAKEEPNIGISLITTIDRK